jgi:hypothetical protein
MVKPLAFGLDGRKTGQFRPLVVAAESSGKPPLTR